MADPLAAVTDTHALLFHSAGSGRLGRRAATYFEACERREALLYVPAAVIWECALLARAGRVNLRRSVRDFFGDLSQPGRYLTVDSWDSAEHRAAMLVAAREEYAHLDRSCEELTESERDLGAFAVNGE